MSRTSASTDAASHSTSGMPVTFATLRPHASALYPQNPKPACERQAQIPVTALIDVVDTLRPRARAYKALVLRLPFLSASACSPHMAQPTLTVNISLEQVRLLTTAGYALCLAKKVNDKYNTVAVSTVCVGYPSVLTSTDVPLAVQHISSQPFRLDGRVPCLSESEGSVNIRIATNAVDIQPGATYLPFAQTPCLQFRRSCINRFNRNSWYQWCDGAYSWAAARCGDQRFVDTE